MIGVGIIGAGYWGPKHVRNFNELPETRATMVADLDIRRLGAIQAQFPGIRATTDFRHVLASPDVDAIVVATPVSTRRATRCTGPSGPSKPLSSATGVYAPPSRRSGSP